MMAQRMRHDYPTPSPSPSPSPPPTVKQEELSLSDSIAPPHLESTSTLALTLPISQIQPRRSPTNLEIVQPLRQLQTHRRVASIGPSSPESRWSTKHMSYSLTYHLVETALQFFPEDAQLDPVDYPVFLARFRASRGRSDEFDSIEELFALGQMVVGAHFSVHSALLRTTATLPKFDSLPSSPFPPAEMLKIGFARRPALVCILAQLSDRLDRQINATPATFSEVKDQLSIAHFAGLFLAESVDFFAERVRVLQSSIQQGITFLKTQEISQQSTTELVQILRELAREEIRQSLVIGRQTSLSPEAYHRILGSGFSPPFPSLPQDFSFIFDTKNVEPDTLQTALHYQNTTVPSILPIFHHLRYLLAYTPSEYVSNVVHAVDPWDLHDTSLAIVDEIRVCQPRLLREWAVQHPQPCT
ncbi:hypothetical protein JCM3765_005849, partial [Sporobolomyces pararoseus]